MLVATLLLVGILALIPVWRLRVAGWPPRWLFAAWLVIALMGLLVLRLPGPARFLLPFLVLAYVAPFVAGPERLTRVLGGGPAAREVRGVIIDVTPRLPPRPNDDDDADPGADDDPRRT
jgi:hypothetical protein